MRLRISCGMLVLLGMSVTQQVTHSEEPLPDKVTFNRHIRPILSENCYQCHGPDRHQRKGDLRLDTASGATSDLGGSQAVHPGKPGESALWERINETDPELMMPPAEMGKTLSSQQKALLKKWIEQGGEYEKHWAFVSPMRSPLPEVSQPNWPRNEIDRFVLSRLDREKLSPARPADKRTLIRRVTLDLTGLPPRPEHVEAFVNDSSPDAWEKVVDRLLNSPEYGEHLARYWLDGARYADTNGYQYDLEREQWAWRDWVIHAFNTNKPFDEFTIEQLAGDLLPNATENQKLATGFNRNHPITIEGGVIDEEYRTEYVVDRVVTTSTVWMGMTFLCARCHDHKYDPLPQQEFYQFFAYFNQVPERGLNGFEPRLKTMSPIQKEQIRELKRQLPAAEKELQEAVTKYQIPLEKLEQKLQGQIQKEWKIVRSEKVKSTGGATLKVLEDESVLASGKTPATDTYEVILNHQGGSLAALRLEALTHSSLPHNGAGRGSNANFVLTEVEVEIALPDHPDKFKKLKIARATADYSQANYPIDATIDGVKTGRGGWAVDGPTKRENRMAYFFLNTKEDHPTGTRIRIRMIHNWGGSHQIGCFRWSVSDTGSIAIPENIRTAILIPRNKRTPEQQSVIDEYFLLQNLPSKEREVVEQISRLRKRLTDLEKKIPSTLVMKELPKPRTTHFLYRGEYNQKRDVVQPGTPSVLPPFPKNFEQNRLGLAKWLVMPEQPLTSRVTVNRIWQRLFGRGLVKTSEDFGSQGTLPSHPDLLDWLAVEFQESGWDLKRLHKLIVMSSTYQQSSHVTKAQRERDPENRLLARGARFRLDAEVIRDSVLAASGLLHQEVGGPSVFPYHPKGLWQEINNRPGYSRTYKEGTGDDLYRRSLYTFWKRTVPPPSMAIFDAPEREFCVVRRSRTNTPLQALVLMNGPLYVEASIYLAEKLQAGDLLASDDQDQRTDEKLLRNSVQQAMNRCLGRSPSEEEMTILQNIFQQRLEFYQKNPQAIASLSKVGQQSENFLRDRPHVAAFADVVRVLFNLSEFITRE